MTQTISDLGEIGVTGAILSPLDLPILRAGAAWNLTGYSNPRIAVWNLRTRTAIATPGPVTIEAPETDGIIQWKPTAANFPSGSYEARITVENAATDDEPSGVFRFSIAAEASP